MDFWKMMRWRHNINVASVSIVLAEARFLFNHHIVNAHRPEITVQDAAKNSTFQLRVRGRKW